MARWERQPQERKGNCLFSGKLNTTKGVSETLAPEDILAIHQDARTFALEQGGISHLQIYKDEIGRRVYIIDNLDKEILENGGYSPDEHFCTILLGADEF